MAAHKVLFAVGAVVLLTAVNLRGLRESGTAFAIPTYGFMIVIVGMILTGLVRIFVLGHAGGGAQRELHAPGRARVHRLRAGLPAAADVHPGRGRAHRRRGDLQRGAGVQQAQEPQRRHHAAAARHPLGEHVLGLIALARLTGLQFVEDPATAVRRRATGLRAEDGHRPARRDGVLRVPSGFYVVVVMTALILFLAANTAFNGFPVLGSILAQDRYLPRQLHTRGDRLAFSNGILILAAFAIVLIVGFQAEVTRLIQLYIVGRVRLVHAVADRHDAALEPAAAHRDRTGRPGGGCAGPGRSTPSARS